MNILLSVVSIAMFALQSASLKQIQVKSLRQNILTTGLSAGLIAVALGIWAAITQPVFSAATLGYGIAFGVLFIVTVAAYYFAMQSGPLSYTGFFFSASMLIPSVAGLLFWGEPFSPGVGAGIGLFLLAFFCITVFGGPKGGKANVRWMVLCFVTWFCNGSLSILMNLQQKAQQSAGLSGESSQMMLVSFAAGFLTAILLYALLARKGGRTEDFSIVRKAAIPMVLVAAGTGGGNVLIAYLTGVLPSSYLFPFVQGGTMIAVTLYSMVALKEKINWFGKIGILLGLCAIVVINL